MTSRLEEYKAAVSLYRQYKSEKKKLQEERWALEPQGLKSFFYFGLSFAFYSLLFRAFSGDYAWLIVAFWLGWITWIGIKENDFALNLVTRGKLAAVDKKIEKVESLLEDIVRQIRPYEENICRGYEIDLEEFFQKNIYRKRSGTDKFESALGELWNRIKAISELNENLVTTSVRLEYYSKYLINRLFTQDRSAGSISKEVSRIRQTSSQLAKKSVERILPPEEFFRTPRKVDWEALSKKRREIGKTGEGIVIAMEKDYLESLGRGDLAERVRHTSVIDGDGAGYDVASFFEDGKEKFIEVKSTTGPLSYPFYASRNELDFLKRHSKEAFIYRISIAPDTVISHVMSYEEVIGSNEIVPVQYLLQPKQDTEQG